MNVTADHHDVLCQKLAGTGQRATPQREVVYNVILAKRDHPTADEIHARVKAQMPATSLATVYNCLETLVQCGLVKQVNFDRGPSRYCPNLAEHAHFHDEATGAIWDVNVPPALVAQLRSLLPDGLDASSIELNFRGRARTATAG